MTKKELEAKVRELEARIALLEAQKPQQVMVPVPYYPQPYWVPTVPSFSQYCPPNFNVNFTCGAGAVAEEGALNIKTYTFGQ